MRKEFLKTLVAFGLTFSLVGCGEPKQTAEKDGYDVVILKQLDHSSMDEIADAIYQEITSNSDVQAEILSGQNDPSILQQIVSDTKDSNKDLIIPIGSMASNIAAVTKDDLHVVFAAVCDPEKAELTDLEHVSGTSDAINVESILDMMKAFDENLSKVGLLYCQSEANSAKPIAEIKELLEKNNIEYVEACGNSSDEIIQAASSLTSDQVDAVFTPVDNKVMACAPSVAKIFANAKIPHYTGADSFVTSGSFATCGVDYVELGKQTAKLAYEKLLNPDDPTPVIQVIPGSILMVNQETAKAIGKDPKVLEDLGQVVLVETERE